MKTFTLQIADTAADVTKIGSQYGFHFNSARVALAERLGNFQAVVFCDTDEDEPGFFLNVVSLSEDGQPSQWKARDPEMDFQAAIAQVGAVALLPLGAFVTELGKLEQIL